MILATLLASFLVADIVNAVPAAVGIAEPAENALVAAVADDAEGYAPPAFVEESAVVDMRVRPLLKAKWGQGNVGSSPCYNFSTPHNLKVGCAAVAMGQVMRYWQYPSHEMTIFSNKCSRSVMLWDTETMTRTAQENIDDYLISSGVETGVRTYDFSLMVEDPASETLADENRAAIGMLLADCAISLSSKYKGNYSEDWAENLGSVVNGQVQTHSLLGESSYPEITTADPSQIAYAMRSYFGYTNACVYLERSGTAQSQELWQQDLLLGKLINSNLDAGRPVIIVFGGSPARDTYHSAVADGYGFIKGDDGNAYEYVHLNLGWEGKGDGWYRLPKLDTSSLTDVQECGASLVFETISAVIYNISPVKPGSIISGVVGKSLSSSEMTNIQDVAVSLYAKADVAMPEFTYYSNEKGIFAFETEFEITTNILLEAHYDDPEKGPMVAEEWLELPQSIVSEKDYSLTSRDNIGNLWQKSVLLEEANAIVDGVGYLSLERALTAAELSSSALPVIEIVDEIEFGSVEWEIERDIVIRSASKNAALTTILRSGSGVLKIKEGVNVLFTNVCFQALGSSTPVVEVEDNATCQIAGDVQLDAIRLLDGGRLDVTAPLNIDRYYTVDTCLSTNDVFGVIFGDDAQKEVAASLFVHASDEHLVGKFLPDGSLSWVEGEPPESATVLKLVQDGVTVNFRSFDMLIKAITNDCEILVVENCVFTNKFQVSHDVVISSYASTKTVSSPVEFAADESFNILEGGKLTLNNIKFTGHVGGQFITLSGGELVIGDGAELFNIENSKTKYGGAVYAESGKVMVLQGALVHDVRVSTTGGMGGFACISPYAQIELAGGIITNCQAKAYGGAIYAAYQNDSNMARVDISGPAVVFGNTALSQAVTLPSGCDIFVNNTKDVVYLTGDASGGRIGLLYASSSTLPRNSQSNVFAVVEAASLSENQLYSSAKAFVSNADESLFGGVSEDGTTLVWHVESPKVHLPLEGDNITNACVMVVFDDQMQTQYWKQVDWALNSLTSDATLILLAGHSMTEKVVITNNVFIYSLDSNLVLTNAATDSYFDYTLGSHVYHRTTEILLGATLSVSNFTITASEAAGPLFDVRGEFVLDGAKITDVKSSSLADDTAVWVAYGGVFEMRNAARIENCSSSATDSLLRVGSAVRSLGGVVRLNGCSINGCSGVAGGALYFGASTIVEIGGEISINGNVLKGGEDANLVIAATRLTLVSELKGEVGVMPIYSAGGSTNIFASVSDLYEGDLDSLTNSASMFVNDITKDVGVVVTNLQGEAFIAWATSISRDSLTLEVNHEEYHLVGQLPEMRLPEVPLAEPTPVAFTQIRLQDDGYYVLKFTNAVTKCRYYLYATNSLVDGFVIPEDGSGSYSNFVSEVDGEASFLVPNIGDAQFFKVLALPEAPLR